MEPPPAAHTDIVMFNTGGQSNMGLTVGTGPFTTAKDAPVWGFHADNGTAESAAAARYVDTAISKPCLYTQSIQLADFVSPHSNSC